MLCVQMDQPDVSNIHVVGKRILTQWRLTEAGSVVEAGGRLKWLNAEVTGFNSITGEHSLRYSDGQEEELNLLFAERNWKVVSL